MRHRDRGKGRGFSYMDMDGRMRKMVLDDFHRPTFCSGCRGVLVYRGLGEYQCEDCGAFEYDDYGKVRNYLDRHRGANVAEISDATGVTHKSIRDMIKDSRFEVINNAGGYIRCEMCGANINSGRLCSKCEMIYHRQIEEEARAKRKAAIHAGSAGMQGESGSKRFTRER